jgi:exosortase A-associated hydrolase 1
MAALSEMSWQEEALAITCGAERLVAVLARPSACGDTGVVIVVGGPQYRVGSHRQFVLLARALAQAGIPALRFDVRGMGDSTGPMQSFETSAQDIDCAIGALVSSCPTVCRVALWGLCDAASAILLHARVSEDQRIAGLVLANPWVRSEASHARTRLVHYYGKRLLQREFWKKALRLEVDFADSAASVARHVASAGRGTGRSEPAQFQTRMADGWRAFRGPVLLLVSGQDLTAREFLDYAASEPAWRGLLDGPRVTRNEFPEADHTFSTVDSRHRMEGDTLQWLLERVVGSRS